MLSTQTKKNVNKKLNIKPHQLRFYKQQGTILILVLLIVAVVAGLSIKFASVYQLGVARAETRWFGTQMRAYFSGGETVVANMLMRDPAESDHLKEDWFQQSGYTLPLEGGDITFELADPSGQINLNALLQKIDTTKALTDPQAYDQNQRQFIRLLQEFSDDVRSVDEAAIILRSVVYWATPVDPYQLGEDDQYYVNAPEPYRAAHSGSFRSVEELQLVRGVTPSLMNQLRPFITAMSVQSKMNINTLVPELLRTINVKSDLRPTDLNRAQKFYTDLLDKPVKQLAELEPLLNAQFGQGVELDKDFDNKTQFFWLVMTARMGDQVRTQSSLLQRSGNNKPFVVVRRQEGSVFIPNYRAQMNQ